jgi:hypothetical protein
MPAQATNELRDFHRFLGEVLSDGRSDWSPEEALDEWRGQHPNAHASEEDVVAVQEALTDLANGDRGIPFEEFDRDFRQRHNLPGKP